MENNVKKEELRNAALDYIKNGGDLPSKQEVDAYGRFVFISQALRELYSSTEANRRGIGDDKKRLDATIKWVKAIGVFVLILVIFHLPTIAEEADTVVKWILALL